MTITAPNLMKMIYYDPKAETRLETYADTVVIEKDGYTRYIAAIRFGGYPESVKGMSEAIYGGGSIRIEIDGIPITAYSRVKQYRKELTHDGIYAEATLMIRDDQRDAGPNDRCGGDEDGNNTNIRPRKCYLMGTRCKRKNGSDLVSELASLVLEPDSLRELTDLPEGRYQLPVTEKKVNLFKGAEFNVTELAEQLNKSTSFSRLFEKNKLDGAAKRPLLPLNLGQVGLIGGSGLINGLVECDTPHIIKGRIVKENNINKEENLNNKGEWTSTILTETRSNKMIFNLLTPRGFLSLADYSNNANDDTGGDVYAA